MPNLNESKAFLTITSASLPPHGASVRRFPIVAFQHLRVHSDVAPSANRTGFAVKVPTVTEETDLAAIYPSTERPLPPNSFVATNHAGEKIAEGAGFTVERDFEMGDSWFFLRLVRPPAVVTITNNTDTPRYPNSLTIRHGANIQLYAITRVTTEQDSEATRSAIVFGFPSPHDRDAALLRLRLTPWRRSAAVVGISSSGCRLPNTIQYHGNYPNYAFCFEPRGAKGLRLWLEDIEAAKTQKQQAAAKQEAVNNALAEPPSAVIGKLKVGGKTYLTGPYTRVSDTEFWFPLLKLDDGTYPKRGRMFMPYPKPFDAVHFDIPPRTLNDERPVLYTATDGGILRAFTPTSAVLKVSDIFSIERKGRRSLVVKTRKSTQHFGFSAEALAGWPMLKTVPFTMKADTTLEKLCEGVSSLLAKPFPFPRAYTKADYPGLAKLAEAPTPLSINIVYKKAGSVEHGTLKIEGAGLAELTALVEKLLQKDKGII